MSADALAPLLVVVALALVVLLVGAPLRRGPQAAESTERIEREALEAARDGKYRELRELELDHATGKVGEEDFRAQDRELRGEAVAILRRLDELD